MTNMIEGKVWKLGDNIDTDVILPGQFLNITDNQELGLHALEGLGEGYAKKFSQGDVLVGGRNFGCGSSREQAPVALRYAGIRAVIAESFGRIFYRNALNVGLLVLECKGISDFAAEGEVLRIDTASGEINVPARSVATKAKPVPAFLLEIINDGGLIPHLKKAAAGK